MYSVYLGVECDDRYFSLEDGTCIDVSVPGAIPNWFGAPAVKLGTRFNQGEPAIEAEPDQRHNAEW